MTDSLSIRARGVLRLALAATFAAVALVKLIEEKGRTQRMHALRLDDGLLVVVAVVELLIAAGLLTRRWRVAAQGAFVFGASAAAYLIVVKLLGLDVTICGCFGTRRVGVGGHFAVTFGIMLTSLALFGGELESADEARSEAADEVRDIA